MSERTQQQQNAFICTSARTAGKLFYLGYTAEIACNPWKPTYKAWYFPFSVELCEDLKRIFEEYGKPLPVSVQNYMKRINGEFTD